MKLENFLHPDWSAPKNVQALITVKDSAVLENRRQIITPSPAISIKQQHTAIIARLPVENTPVADAVITTNPQVICCVTTADCLPILFCHKQALEVGAIHAGWRGLAAGVIHESLKHLTYQIQDYLFWLGPCISEHAFEVEQDVLDHFASFKWPSAVLKKAFVPKAHPPTKFLGNLRLLAKDVLTTAGVLESQISASNLCTYRDQELFHSYRRDKARERMRSLIWIGD